MAAEESYPELLFICIFWLLHAIFSLTEYIMAFCYILSAKWRSVFSKDLEAVDIEAVKNISKLPKHIAFLVLENDILYDDVAKLVIWSLLVGINVVSLYDVHGKMKKNQGKLLGAINREYIKYLGIIEPFKLSWRPHDDLGEVSEKRDTVIVSRNGVMYPDKNGNGVSSLASGNGLNGHHNCNQSQNGHVRNVSISLLSREDGKQDIVNAAKSLGRELRAGCLGPEDMSINTLGSHLNTNRGLSDPCVLVRVGGVASNMDFPPWHLRLTEMFSIPSLRNVTPHTLFQVLRRYGRCEQRLGK